MKLWQLLSYLSYVAPKKKLVWTIIFPWFFLSFSPLFFSLTEKKIANVGQMGRTSVTFYIGFDPEQNSGSHLICGCYFSCPAAFSRVFYVVFQIFKLKHFCNELLHERTRAIYMGELRKNTTSTGTITKKTWILWQKWDC